MKEIGERKLVQRFAISNTYVDPTAATPSVFITNKGGKLNEHIILLNILVWLSSK